MNRTTGKDNALSQYYRKLRKKTLPAAIEFYTTPIPEKPSEQHIKNARQCRAKRADIPRGVCTLIQAHHEALKDDPERLTTDFMEEIIGVKCNFRKETS